jgi:hypothetical protein
MTRDLSSTKFCKATVCPTIYADPNDSTQPDQYPLPDSPTVEDMKGDDQSITNNSRQGYLSLGGRETNLLALQVVQ